MSQGCTLGPLLFVVVTSILMQDAVALLGGAARAAYDAGKSAGLVYADDTLLLGVNGRLLTEFLGGVSRAGAR